MRVLDRAAVRLPRYSRRRLVAGIFVRWGIDLPMAVGAIAMSASTIIVAANAQLLRRLRLRREPMVPSQLIPETA